MATIIVKLDDGRCILSQRAGEARLVGVDEAIERGIVTLEDERRIHDLLVQFHAKCPGAPPLTPVPSQRATRPLEVAPRHCPRPGPDTCTSWRSLSAHLSPLCGCVG